MAPKSFNPKTQTYTSPRPPIPFPTDPNLSLTSFPNNLALADSDTAETLTFLQLKSLVSKLAHALLNLNIKKNDVVLIFSPNSIHFPVCFFSIVAIGAIATTCNPQSPSSQVKSTTVILSSSSRSPNSGLISRASISQRY
ncbi:hypothetical protein ACE6H2_024367 [Prunus campanulata]